MDDRTGQAEVLAAGAAGGRGGAAQAEAMRLARAGTVRERAGLACLPDTAPELLYFLAHDPVLEIRAAVAANPATPARADSLLAADADPRLRALLGRKLAPLAGGLSADAQDRLQRLAWQTLRRLAADTAELVRAAIAEELKAMPDAPRALILALAADQAMSVAEPIIRFSPLLTEADLLALVATPPVPATVTAVARRPGLSEALTDAIVATADAVAIGALLENRTAAIRESTLDAVIAGAATEVTWQEPLVHRPALSAGMLATLVSMVADHLLAPLAARPDLSPEVAATLRARVGTRLAQPPESTPTAAFEAAARAVDRGAMVGLLATQGALPEELVRRAIRLRSARGLISLCWKAGLRPQVAGLAQTVLGGLSPGEMLAGLPNAWALTPEEMSWQIKLLRESEG